MLALLFSTKSFTVLELIMLEFEFELVYGLGNFGDPKNDIFDNLLYVRNTHTNEYGYLFLTNEYHWDNPLIEEADWIQGARVPKSYREDSRLVLGCHDHEHLYIETRVDVWDYEEDLFNDTFLTLYVHN